MDFNIFTCLLVLFVKDSKGRSFCNSTLQPVVNVCSDQEVTNKRAIYIDTFGVQNKVTSCDCVIRPCSQHIDLQMNLVNLTGQNTIQFKINDIIVGKFCASGKTQLKGTTNLLFSTLENHRRDGVCLAVYSENGSFFNISCTSAKRVTTTQTSQSSTEHRIKTTKYKTTFRPTYSTVHPSTVKENGEKDENVTKISIVFGTCGFVSGIVIALVCALCYIRKKKGKVTTSPKRQSTRPQAEGDYYMTENPMYNMSPNGIIGGNIENAEHHNVAFNQQNVGTSSYNYEIIQETLEGKHCPDHPSKHAVTYDYAVCNVSKNNNKSEESSRPPVQNKAEDSKSLSVMATDETIYDSTKEKSPKQPPGLNDYHHLTPYFTGKCLTYDTIENTSVIKS